MYCSRCGALNPEPARFCIVCGQVIFRAPSAPPLPYADFFPRVLARVIDSLILSPLLLGWVGIIFWAIPRIPNIPHGGKLSEQEIGQLISAIAPAIALGILWVVVSIAANWLYHAMLESSGNQGTFGKRIMGLVVTNLEGKRITFGRASVRWIVSVMLTSQTMLIGYIMVAFTEKKQSLHDMLAETLVLSGTPPPEPPAP